MSDIEDGKIIKMRRLNPVGEDIYLNSDGTLTRDEDKIIVAQRIFLHNYYKPGGKGAAKALEKYKELDR
jgi:hypothetical protein